MTYAYLDNFLSKRDSRTVPSIRATYINRMADGSITVQYHRTIVVRADKDGTFTLNSGGYRTATTKERIKAYSPAVLYQKAHRWYLAPRNQDGTINWAKDARVEFYDGMRIDAAGNVLPRE